MIKPRRSAAASRDEISDNNAENYDDWYSVPLEQVDNFENILWKEINYVTSKTSKFYTQEPMQDVKQRISEPVRAIIYDIDDEYNVNSISKTMTALMLMGARRYMTDILDGCELGILNTRIREYKANRRAAGVRKICIDDAIIQNARISMPGARFKDEMSSALRDYNEREPTHYFLLDCLKEVLGNLDILGLKHGTGHEFLIMLAIDETSYALSCNMMAEVHKIIDVTVKGIKDIIYS